MSMFSPISQPFPRSGHVAVCSDRFMLVWGGYTDLPESAVWEERYLPPEEVLIYDSLTEIWRKRTTTGEIPSGTSGACAAVINNNMYIAGGHMALGNTGEAFRLDLTTWKWYHIDIELEDQTMSPRDKCAFWAYRDRLYVFGGFGVPTTNFLSHSGEYIEDDSTFGQRGWNNQLLYLDVSTHTWHNPKCKGDVPSPRAAHATACINDRVFMFGGRHAEQRLNELHQLDLLSLVWTRIDTGADSCVPCGRSWHSLSPIDERYIFLYGGYTQEQTPLSDGWLLDTKTFKWTSQSTPNNKPRLWHTGCCTVDGDILIFGGCSNDILSMEEPTMHCSDVLTYRLSPKSLYRLCLDMVFSYRSDPNADWSILPKSIEEILQARLRREETFKRNEQQNDCGEESVAPTNSSQSRATCCIS